MEKVAQRPDSAAKHADQTRQEYLHKILGNPRAFGEFAAITGHFTLPPR